MVLRRGREDEVGGRVEVSCPDKVDRFVVASWLSVPWDEMRGDDLKSKRERSKRGRS